MSISLHFKDCDRDKADQINHKGPFVNVIQRDFCRVSHRLISFNLVLQNKLKQKMDEEKRLEYDHGCDHLLAPDFWIVSVPKADEGGIIV